MLSKQIIICVKCGSSIIIMLVGFSYNPQFMTGIGFLSIYRRKMHGILFSDLRSFFSPQTSIGFHKKLKTTKYWVFKKDYFYRNFPPWEV